MPRPLSDALASARVRSLVPLALVVLLGCIFHGDGAFFVWATHRVMLGELSVRGILACGMTVVIITAGIDLAVGSVLALSAVSFALLTMPYGWSAPAAIAGVLLLGTVAGTCSGTLTARFR